MSGFGLRRKVTVEAAGPDWNAPCKGRAGGDRRRPAVRPTYESRIEGALDEFVRYGSPILVFTRTATRGTVLHGVPLTAGDKVALFYCSGNRDEPVFTDPGHFDLARPRAQHVAFGGGGVHFCLGSAVARAQMKALFREVLTRLQRLEIGEPEYLFSDVIHGAQALPARLPVR